MAASPCAHSTVFRNLLWPGQFQALHLPTWIWVEEGHPGISDIVQNILQFPRFYLVLSLCSRPYEPSLGKIQFLSQLAVAMRQLNLDSSDLRDL